MYRPKVFLSHSTKGDPDAAAMRRHLESELTARGWDVLVDEDGLRGGEEWRGVLYHWIADCDAAVVLMSDKALASAWVRREINLLLWRRALGSPLTIVPAELSPTADTGAPELKDLRELQFVPTAEPAMFAAAIAARLPDLSSPVVETSDRMRLWLVDVVSCLREVTEHEPLRAAARALDAHQEDWHFPSIDEGQRFLAHLLLGPTHVGRIHTAIEHVARPASGKLKQLVGLVTPAWVDGEAARALLPDQRQTCAVLNAEFTETAEQYVRRAACCALNYRTAQVGVVTGENLEAELLRDCEQAVRDLADLLPDDELTDDITPLENQVCFLLVHLNEAALASVANVVLRLQTRFAWLNVIVLTGKSADVTGEQWRQARAIVLPALDAGEETLVRRTSMRLRKLLKEVAS